MGGQRGVSVSARLRCEDERRGGEREAVEHGARNARHELPDAGHAQEEADHSHLSRFGRAAWHERALAIGKTDPKRAWWGRGCPAHHYGEGGCEGGVGCGPGRGVESTQAPGCEEARQSNLRGGRGMGR